MREGAAVDGDKERGSSGVEDGVEVELGSGQEQSWQWGDGEFWQGSG